MLIMDGEVGGGRVSDSSARSEPQKSEEAVDHRQNNYVKAARAKQLVYFANCCFNSCA